jgi:transketolase
MAEQPKMDLREVMVQCFIRAVQDNVNLVVLVSDSTSTAKIAPFQEKYPDRLINVGIAEQNLVGVAVGLSLGGYVAVTANAACFLVARANEQVKNDVCYSDMNVKLVGLNAGVSYGPLASTHHAIDDISIMRGLGNIIILAPSDPVETEKIFDFALRHVGPVYIRMDNAKFPVLHSKDYQFELGKADVLTYGDDVSIFAMGSVVHEAYAAAQTLKNNSINAEVINVSSIRPVDKKAISDSIQKTKKVITVEEHSLHGGLGSLICEIIAEEGLGAKIVRLGITQGHFAKAGPRDKIRAFYKIDKNGILETARKLLRKD